MSLASAIGRRLEGLLKAFENSTVASEPGGPADLDKSLVTARDRFYAELVAAATSGLERASAGAQAVRNASAAIGVIYSAILGVSFSIDRPLPPRGVIPAIFLGLALVMATAYEAFPVEAEARRDFPDESKPPLASIQEYAVTYMLVVTDRANLRRYALRVSILSLAFGVAFLPVGFISLGSTASDAQLPPWPRPTSLTSDELTKTLFESQVAEVADVRRSILHASPTESFDRPGVVAVYIAFLVALVLVFFHPYLWKLSAWRKSRRRA